MKTALMAVVLALVACGPVEPPPPPPPPPPPSSPFNGIFTGTFLVNENCQFGADIMGPTGNNQTISILESPASNLNINISLALGQLLLTCSGQTATVSGLTAQLDSNSCIRPFINDPNKQERVDVNGGTLQLSTDHMRLVLHAEGTIWPLSSSGQTTDICPAKVDGDLQKQ